jgi:hypothetical protein
MCTAIARAQVVSLRLTCDGSESKKGAAEREGVLCNSNRFLSASSTAVDFQREQDVLSLLAEGLRLASGLDRAGVVVGQFPFLQAAEASGVLAATRIRLLMEDWATDGNMHALTMAHALLRSFPTLHTARTTNDVAAADGAKEEAVQFGLYSVEKKKVCVHHVCCTASCLNF